MAEEKSLEESVKEKPNVVEAEVISETNSKATEKLETKAAEAPESNTGETTEDGKIATATNEYIDPVTEEYLIERENLITCQWSLFYELDPKKDKMTNMRLGW